MLLGWGTGIGVGWGFGEWGEEFALGWQFGCVAELAGLVLGFELVAVDFVSAVEGNSSQKLLIFLPKKVKLLFLHNFMFSISRINIKQKRCKISIRANLSNQRQRIHNLLFRQIFIPFVGKQLIYFILRRLRIFIDTLENYLILGNSSQNYWKRMVVLGRLSIFCSMVLSSDKFHFYRRDSMLLLPMMICLGEEEVHRIVVGARLAFVGGTVDDTASHSNYINYKML